MNAWRHAACARREAAEKAGQFTEAALMGAMPMCVPNFKNVVMPAIIAALDEWKHEAIKSEWRGAAAAAAAATCCVAWVAWVDAEVTLHASSGACPS